jgi:hypothetical protein
MPVVKGKGTADTMTDHLRERRVFLNYFCSVGPSMAINQDGAIEDTLVVVFSILYLSY